MSTHHGRVFSAFWNRNVCVSVKPLSNLPIYIQFFFTVYFMKKSGFLRKSLPHVYQILNSGDYKKLSLVVKSIFQTKGSLLPVCSFFPISKETSLNAGRTNYSAEWQKKLQGLPQSDQHISETATRGGSHISQPTQQSKYNEKITGKQAVFTTYSGHGPALFHYITYRVTYYYGRER